MKHYKNAIIAFIAFVVLGVPWIISVYPQSTKFVDDIFSYVGNNYTAVFLRQAITVTQLHTKYEAVSNRLYSNSQPKVRIMIVAGHEPDFGGTEFGDLREREMTVDLANELKTFFDHNPHYEAIVSRDKQSWNPKLEKYFKENWDSIISFIKENREEMVHSINNGSVKKPREGVMHNSASKNVAIRLYGINKWNNENKIDIAIHIHFNDYPRSNRSKAGEYNGFAIYVPEKQFSNSATTRDIADAVFKRLSKYNAKSNLPIEDDGIVEEQELIAIGSHNTLDAPSMLIEYGYIYEPQFTDATVRKLVIKDLAFQTYLGIQDFFGSGNDFSLAYDTLILPHKWNNNIDKNNADKKEVIALQSALILEGVYPPKNISKNDCPRSGRFGPCTIDALTTFQNKFGIKGESGVVGEQTKKVLNDQYSVEVK